MMSSTTAGEKTAKKKALITDNGGLVWGINNKGIVAVMDNGNWTTTFGLSPIVVVHDNGF